MQGYGWVFDPHSGGSKVPPRLQEETRKRILAHAEKNYKGTYTRLDVRFRGPFCYIDAYTEPEAPEDWPPPGITESREAYIERLRNTPTHLVRLRYFAGHDKWSVAFFAYSSMKYEPAVYDNGSWLGTPEEGFDIGAVYLTE